MSKKKEEEEEEVDSNAWMITFSDLLTLMLTFFVMLLTMSAIDNKKLKESFGLYNTGGTDAIGGTEGGLVGLPLKQVPKRKMLVDAEELEVLFAKLVLDAETKFSGFSEREIRELYNIHVKNEPEGIIVYLPNALLFKPGKNEINPQSRTILSLLGNWLKEKLYSLKVEGHTDNIRGAVTESLSNWELSVNRAVNVMRYFLEKKIIEKDKIAAFGYNGFQPLVPNDSVINRQKNKRTEIIFIRPT